MTKSTNDTLNPSLKSIQLTLRQRIKYYKKRAEEIKTYLQDKPDESGRFQSEFNNEVNKVFKSILDFEEMCIKENKLEKVLKLKNIFVKRFKHVFNHGIYGPWCMARPYGYSGDFKIISDIYANNPTTIGFDMLFDNYFLSSAISVAVRNRKNDFKRKILEEVQLREKGSLRIMNLGCGPCTEITEILNSKSKPNCKIRFDCYDQDINALNFSKNNLLAFNNVKFHQFNALKLTATLNPLEILKRKYDLIYSAGLFDYFNNKISARLVKNLMQLLNKNGKLLISTVTNKFMNPSVHYMEWAGDWILFYRSKDEFKKIFIDANVPVECITEIKEKSGIMQYIIAQKT